MKSFLEKLIKAYVDYNIEYDEATSKLELLETKAKCLYVPNNREEALNLQMEIQGQRSYIRKLKEYIANRSDKYFQMALGLGDIECELMVMIFFQNYSCEQISRMTRFPILFIQEKKELLAKKIMEQKLTPNEE